MKGYLDFAKIYKKRIEGKFLYFCYMPVIIVICVVFSLCAFAISVYINKNVTHSTIFVQASLVATIIYFISYIFIYIKALIIYIHMKDKLHSKNKCKKKEQTNIVHFIETHIVTFLILSILFETIVLYGAINLRLMGITDDFTFCVCSGLSAFPFIIAYLCFSNIKC